MSDPFSGRRLVGESTPLSHIPVDPAQQISTEAERPESLTAARRVVGGDRRLFSLSLLWTFLGTIIPGVGLLRAGRRAFGTLVLLGAFGTLGAGVVMWFVARRQLLRFAVDPTLLYGLALAAVIIGLLWIVTIGITHLALRPSAPTTWQRATGAVVVAILSFAVGAPFAVAARTAADQASFVDTVFKETKSATKPSLNTVDPWAKRPRLNVLMLGGDSGRNRNEEFGDRTDTVMVASIDTKTGEAVMFSLPRNTAAVPFPKDSPMAKRWPRGFTNGDPNDPNFFLNAIYQDVPDALGKKVLGETDNVGADVLKLAVGEALGLKIDYYLMVNLDGFTDLVDALGGVTVNINQRIPVGGSSNRPPDGWLDPGPNQLLDGQRALWYARSRYGADDYQRMDRQRCVVNAVLKQAQPANVVANYESILRAGKRSVRTDIPKEMLPALVELGVKAQSNTLHSIVFKHGVDGFYSTHPNWDQVRNRVQQAIANPNDSAGTRPASSPAAPTAAPAANPTPKTNPGTGAKTSPTPIPTAGGGAQNTDDACAYNPTRK